MVYCGKPSRACRQCKERRVKCDLKDNCRPCRTAKLQCSGLRDPTKLVFRDESESTIQKAIRKHQSPGSVPKSITLSIRDRANGFFFTHYVIGKAKTFDYIQTFPLEKDPGLSASLAAVSLGLFSVKASSNKAMEMARRNYGIALRLTQQAVQAGDLATTDTTLLSVLLLDLFEKITKRTPAIFESMTKHASGALALVKLRGKRQFETLVGLRMFLQLWSTILIACIQCDVPVPADLLSLQAESVKYMTNMGPKAQISQAIVRFINLRAAIKKCSLRSSDAVSIAQDLDKDLELISKTMPVDYQYSIVPSQPSEDVYEDYFHVYSDRKITHIWNFIRIVRTLLNEIIIQECLITLGQENSPCDAQGYQSKINHSSGTISLLSAEICASVPQYTLLPRLTKDFSTLEEGMTSTCGRILQSSGLEDSDVTSATPSQPPQVWSELHTPLQCARCYSLIYPLYVAAQSFATPEPLRRWILNSLDTMSAEMGIKEASLAARILERGEQVNPWSVYAMIGSYSFSA